MKKLMVAHGRTTHPIDAKCEFCDKIQRKFEQEFKIPLERMLQKEKAKAVRDFAKKLRKELVKNTCGGAEFILDKLLKEQKK